MRVLWRAYQFEDVEAGPGHVNSLIIELSECEAYIEDFEDGVAFGCGIVFFYFAFGL